MPGRHRRPTSRLGAPTRLALTATAAAVAMQPLAATHAAAATVTPQPTRTLPTALDVVPAYQDQRSCDPAAKPGVEAYARMVLTTYRQGHSGGIVRGCGIGATSEHKEGRAFDWMLSVNNPAEKAAGDALTAWLTGKDAHGVVGGNARRLGVMYVIWNRRIWSTYRIADGWRPYTGSSPHTDHVHTQLHVGRRDAANVLVGRIGHHQRRQRAVPRLRGPACTGVHRRAAHNGLPGATARPRRRRPTRSSGRARRSPP